MKPFGNGSTNPFETVASVQLVHGISRYGPPEFHLQCASSALERAVTAQVDSLIRGQSPGPPIRELIYARDHINLALAGHYKHIAPEMRPTSIPSSLFST